LEGTPFGRYRLVELLGRGGMGDVWRAYDTVTDRVVAVKVLPAHLANDQTFQERFRREARAAAGLNNPHVVPIHDFGEIDGRLFVNMRLIEGEDLESMLARGPLHPARAIRIIEQIGSALLAAHRIGLVHRDVKPSNILVGEDDYAYLIDFGIARAAGESGLTNTGSAVGTWAYMAPERFQTGAADARADVYALTCVLYQSLTGQLPFPGSTLEQIATAHLLQPPPQPSALLPQIPPAMDQVIGTGMAKGPDQRYATTKDLATAARAAITVPQGRPPLASPLRPGSAQPTEPLSPSIPTVAGGEHPAADQPATVLASQPTPPEAPNQPDGVSPSAAPTQYRTPADQRPPSPSSQPARPSRRGILIAGVVALVVITVVTVTAITLTRAPETTSGGPASTSSGPASTSSAPQDADGAMFSGAQPWTKDVSGAPKSDRSDAMIGAVSSMGGWGTDNALQIDFSIPVFSADDKTPRVRVVGTDDYCFGGPDCDAVPAEMPVPENANIGGSSDLSCDISGNTEGQGDCQLLVVDRDGQKLYETYQATKEGQDIKTRGLFVWDLNKQYPDNLRGDQCTSADAGGFPIAALTPTADEVASGSIEHAIRFILPNDRMKAGVYAHPASHAGGPESTDPNAPPFGVRFRLKAGFDESGYTDSQRVILKALKTHGMLLSDGGQVPLTFADDRTSSAKWSQLGIDAHTFSAITADQFEVVDLGPETALTYDCVPNS
jgi:serine/threonine protein kinase